MGFLCGSLCVTLRSSAFSASKRPFNAEIAELRREPQRIHKSATIRNGPPLPLLIFIGSAITLKPFAGN